ncbi:MAG: O-antigen export protein [Mucilaginibacter sp.]
MTALRKKIQAILYTGNGRAIKIKKNIIYSFLIKGTSVFIGYVLFSLTVHYVNPQQYGIWLTISSLVAWVGTFDIGLSNGLRNKLTASLALGEREISVKYISTTYILLFLIACVIFALFFGIGSFFNWNRLLNIPVSLNDHLWLIIVIAMATFCMQFTLQPISSILLATHQPFKSSLIVLVSQALIFLIIYLLSISIKGNLLILVIVVTSCPILVFILANIYFFRTELRAYFPKLAFFDLRIAKSLLNLGTVFFIIQIGALVIYETDNIIITRTLGPADVTIFNAAFKYFSIITIAFTIIITPYWSAFTDAYAIEDLKWIKKSVTKMRTCWLYFSAGTFFLYLFSDFFYKIWVGKTVLVPNSLSLFMAIYVIVQSWQVLHAYLLNGTGKLRVQLILIVATAIINVPLSVYLIRQVGIEGTVIANIILMIIMDVVFTFQSQLIVNKKAKGIWDK